MDIKTYSQLALSVKSTLTGGDPDFRHAVYGLATEAGELVDVLKRLFAYNKPFDLVHLKEEFGDFMWYFNLLIYSRGYNWDELMAHGLEYTEHAYGSRDLSQAFEIGALGMFSEAGMLTEIVLDHLEMPADTTYTTTGRMLGYFTMARQAVGLSLEEILQGNIDKLSVRYPGLKYSDESALNRNLAAERLALEGSSHEVS